MTYHPLRTLVLAVSILVTTNWTSARGQTPIRRPPAPAASPVEVKVTALDANEVMADWILDEASGRLFASGGSKVVEFDTATGAKLRQFPISEGAGELLIKKSKLVVACSAASSLHIIDLTTNAVEGRVQLAGKGPYALFCSKADNNYVYAICNTGSAWWDGEVFQVDVSLRALKNRKRIQQWGQSGAQHVAMSTDGKWIVPDARGHSSPSGADLMAVDEEALTFKQLLHHHESFGPIKADPWGRYWLLGDKLYSGDLKSKLRDFQGNAFEIHPAANLLVAYRSVGRGEREFLFQKFSDATHFGTVPLRLPPASKPAAEALQRAYGDTMVAIDVKRNRAVAAHGQFAHIVDITGMVAKAGDIVAMTLPRQIEATVGVALRVPLTVANPDAGRTITYALQNAPEGMTVQAGQITWIPASKDVGVLDLTVEATGATGGTDSAVIQVNVARPRIMLPGVARHVVTHPASRLALIVATLPQKNAQGEREEPLDPYNSKTSELILIDPMAGKILARRTLNEPVQFVAMDKSSVYVASTQSPRIARLKQADLSDDSKIFASSTLQGLGVTAAGQLIIASDRGMEIHDGIKVQPYPYFAANINAFMHRGMNRGTLGWNPTPVSGGVQQEGLVFDPATGAPVALLINTGFAMLPTAAPPTHINRDFGGFDEGVPAMLWNRRAFQGGEVQGPDRLTVVRAQGPARILREHPLAAVVRNEPIGDRNGRKQRLMLYLHDLTEGAAKEPFTIAHFKDPSEQDNFQFNDSMIRDFGKRLMIVYRKEVFLIDIPEDRLQGLAVPLHLNARTTPLTVNAAAKTTIPLTARGGKGKHTFRLVNEMDGLQIDPTGLITVDGPKLWAAAKTKRDALANQRTLGADVPAYLQQVSRLAQTITGSVPTDIPFDLGIVAEATDEENQLARLSFHVIFLVPKDELVALLKPPVVQRIDTPASRELPEPPAFPKDNSDPANRIRLLEHKIDNLSSMVLDLNRRLQQIEAAKKGAPTP